MVVAVYEGVGDEVGGEGVVLAMDCELEVGAVEGDEVEGGAAVEVLVVGEVDVGRGLAVLQVAKDIPIGQGL